MGQTAYPETVEEFTRITEEFKGSALFKKPLLFAVGRRVATQNGSIASVRYPVVNGPDQNTGTAAILMHVLGIEASGVQNILLTTPMLEEVLRLLRAVPE